MHPYRLIFHTDRHTDRRSIQYSRRPKHPHSPIFRSTNNVPRDPLRGYVTPPISVDSLICIRQFQYFLLESIPGFACGDESHIVLNIYLNRNSYFEFRIWNLDLQPA